MTDRESWYAHGAKLAHTPMLMTLQKKVAPRHTAVLVIDMQNDFCAEGGMMDREGLDVGGVQALAERLPSFLEGARSAGVLVVFVRNVYSTAGNHYLSDAWLEQASRRRAGSYTRYPVCGEGSWEGDFYGAIRPRENDPVITKHRYSAFHNTDLDTVLRAHGIRTLVLTGVAANVCVETTAREAFVRDYYVVFPRDGSACYSDQDQEATLRNVDRYFGEVVELEALRAAWQTAAGGARSGVA